VASPLSSTLRARLRAWALKRQGKDALPLRLRARRVYILPTPAGWTFALLLAVMFVAGMNYGNGLALLFTFWLTGFALVAMVQTQRCLTGLRLTSADASPAHAGDAVRLRIHVEGRTPAADLCLEQDGSPESSVAPSSSSAASSRTQREGKPEDSGQVALDIPVSRRGSWRAPALRLSTTAPFGLFRTWTWLHADVRTLVYPKAAGLRPVPETRGEHNGNLRHHHGQDELAWLRDFREGDSPRQVAWKAYARGQPLLVREYEGEGSLRHEFDFDALHGLDTEERLSQLTRWILDARARGEHWVVRLPGAAPMAGSGDDHLNRCLARLALFGMGEPAA
jgi:uncharacterized protein (DUF58 family)